MFEVCERIRWSAALFVVMMCGAVSACSPTAATTTATTPPVTAPATFDASLLDDDLIERTREMMHQGAALAEQITLPPPDDLLNELQLLASRWSGTARFSPDDIEDLYWQQALNYEDVRVGLRYMQTEGCDVPDQPCSGPPADWQAGLADAQRIESILKALFAEYESK